MSKVYLFYRGGQALYGDGIPEGTDPIWMNDVSCTGNETHLRHCPFGGWGVHSCGHHEDAGVKCLQGKLVLTLSVKLRSCNFLAGIGGQRAFSRKNYNVII